MIYAITKNGQKVIIPSLEVAMGASYARCEIHLTSSYTIPSMATITDRTLVMDRGAIGEIAASTSISIACPVVMMPGSKFTLNAALFLNGGFEADISTHFDGDFSVTFFRLPNQAYPQWWGADPTGTVDSTSAIQKAVNSGIGSLYFTKGSFVVGTDDAVITIAAQIKFIGASSRDSILTVNNATADMIVVTTQQPFCIESMTLGTQVIRTAGAYVRVTTPTGSGNTGSRFSDCNFTNAYDGLYLENAFNWKISQCEFSNYSGSAVFVGNTLAPDAGDSTIEGCLFYAIDTTHGYGVYQVSSGGLRIINNKFLSGITHYMQAFLAAAETSILLFANNSSEWASGGNIVFANAATSSFAYPIINGNEISVSADKIGITVQAASGGTIRHGAIEGNIFNLTTGATTKGVYLGYSQGFSVGTNSFTTTGATAGTGIEVTANSTFLVVHKQTFSNLTADVYNPTATGTDYNKTNNYNASGYPGITITSAATHITPMGTAASGSLVLITDSTTTGQALLLLTDTTITLVANTLTSITFSIDNGYLAAAVTGGASWRILYFVKLST